jgi:CDP-glucose 4,6-dehydratase
MFGDFYRNRRVLVTGHTGFKGSWLALWLAELGARVDGFSLGTVGRPSFYETLGKGAFASETRGDIHDLATLKKLTRRIKPDVIFHLAAQPLVRKSYTDPLDTLSTNAIGTATLLDAVRQTECPASVVVVTTDKCYENRHWNYGYRESDALGGHDVYSASKAAAEIVAHSWRRSFFEPNPKLGGVATARGGNVIGGGDYAVDRLLPDCIRALIAGKTLEIRNPGATRPWQHVLDCLSGYLTLGARLAVAPKDAELATAFNFGPDARSNRSVRELVEQAGQVWPLKWKQPRRRTEPHEASLLHLSTDKAAAVLNWSPAWDFAASVSGTMAWYARRHREKKGRMREFSHEQLAAFTESARRQNIAWAAST